MERIILENGSVFECVTKRIAIYTPQSQINASDIGVGQLFACLEKMDRPIGLIIVWSPHTFTKKAIDLLSKQGEQYIGLVVVVVDDSNKNSTEYTEFADNICIPNLREPLYTTTTKEAAISLVRGLVEDFAYPPVVTVNNRTTG